MAAAQILGQLLGNADPIGAFAKGAQLRAALDGAAAQQQANAFDMLFKNVRRNDENRQFEAKLALQQQERQDRLAYNQARLSLLARTNSGEPQSLGATGDLGGEQPPFETPLPGAAPPTAQSEPSAPDGGPGTYPVASQAVQDEFTKDAAAMRARLAERTGGMSPLGVLSNSVMSEENREKALSVLDFEKKAADLAAGGNTAVVPSLPPAKGLIEPGNLDAFNRKVLDNGDGTSSTASTIGIGDANGEYLIPTVVDGVRLSKIGPDGKPDYTEAIEHYNKTRQHFGKFDTQENASAYAAALHDAQQAQGSRPSLAQLARTKPNESGMESSLFPAGRVAAAAATQPGPTKSRDPYSWENIKEGGAGYKKVSADGTRATIRRKTGGVMIEQLQTIERSANQKPYTKTWPERVIMPDALSKAPMAVQLPADKVQAFDTAKYFLEKIYPKMDVKEAAANRPLALEMHQKMLNLANDPAVQAKQRAVGQRDFVVPPGFGVATMHYDSKTGSMVPLLKVESDAERQRAKDTDKAVKDAWASYDKMQKAATAAERMNTKDAPALQAQADGLLRRVMQLDPAFAATNKTEAPAQDTPSKVSELFKKLVPQ